MAMLLELCSLCPIEPACHRQPMIEYLCPPKTAEDTASAAPSGDFRLRDRPNRCWVLKLIMPTPAPGEESPPAPAPVRPA